uniref:Nudix hydrolase domain-containing protein n=1 Tax=Chaetoceros debilis TaxID=122233 RepID=A0A7S3VGB6_9STRA|mmetsp:Transcript_1578/g.2251  ORF Transcript_1578/g.2251 Transcript_1578/m.2251 type:complete len:235 (+) Transcript_1578:210-914(+)|eukprot:CAMPEP_0194122726 /NCGR_PEP_ID=MMETSP0150-20130528/51760_1 /TAXON_ID=122233 /ORGANISM="Chaetoceros debilis, Strain MM31A-1" /LENGTH=234 /DNA_ID=CAMNT_0038815703 /DNA_START=159 /DNA_END=863 /DNA_ORIENTATION=+
MLPLQKSDLIRKVLPDIRSNLSKHQPLELLPQHVRDVLPKMRTDRKASILIPIIHIKGKPIPSLLFTTRSSNLKSHASQISFPGGHIDTDLDGDCVVKAAVRETREELSHEGNVDSMAYDFDKGLEIIGHTAPIPSIHHIPVTPVLAAFKEEFSERDIETLFPGNKDEVAHVFTISIDELLRMEGEEKLKRLGTKGPVYNSNHGKIWGLTALVLKPYLDKVLAPSFSMNEVSRL